MTSRILVVVVEWEFPVRLHIRFSLGVFKIKCHSVYDLMWWKNSNFCGLVCLLNQRCQHSEKEETSETGFNKNTQNSIN